MTFFAKQEEVSFLFFFQQRRVVLREAKAASVPAILASFAREFYEWTGKLKKLSSVSQENNAISNYISQCIYNMYRIPKVLNPEGTKYRRLYRLRTRARWLRTFPELSLRTLPRIISGALDRLSKNLQEYYSPWSRWFPLPRVFFRARWERKSNCESETARLAPPGVDEHAVQVAPPRGERLCDTSLEIYG